MTKQAYQIINIRLNNKSTADLLIVEDKRKCDNSSCDRWDEQWAVDRDGAVWARRRWRPDWNHVRDNTGAEKDGWLDRHPDDEWGKWHKTSIRQPDYYADAKFPD